MLVALIAFMPTKGDGAIASLDWSEEERRKLAIQSIAYKCEKVRVRTDATVPEAELFETKHQNLTNSPAFFHLCSAGHIIALR